MRTISPYHVVWVQEWIVDSDNLDQWVVQGGSQYKATNSSKSVNTDLDL